MLDEAVPSSSARCAFHADRAAERTCPRCGTFVCASCAADLDGACPRCAERRGSFSLSRDDCSFDRVWQVAMDRFKPNWVMLSVAGFVFFLGAIVANVASSIAQNVVGVVVSKATRASEAAGIFILVQVLLQLAAMLFNMVVQGFLELGLVRVAFDVIEGRPVALERLFSQGRRAFDLVGARLLVTLGVGIPTVLLALIPVVGIALVLGVTDPRGLEAILDSFKSDTPPSAQVVLLFVLAFVWWTALAIAASVAALPFVFVIHEVVYGGAGAGEAIRRAWVIGSGHRWTTFGTQFVVGALVAVGMIACCVGLFPAIAAGHLLTTTLFLALRTGAPVPPPSVVEAASDAHG